MIIKEKENELQNFYFTYGTDPRFPHLADEYVIIRAENELAARDKYLEIYPSRSGDKCLNCAFVYNQKEWDEEVRHYYNGDPVAIYEVPKLNDVTLSIHIMGTFNGVSAKTYLEDGIGNFRLSNLGIRYYDKNGKDCKTIIPVEEMQTITLLGDMTSDFVSKIEVTSPMTFEDFGRVYAIDSLDLDYDCDPLQTMDDYWQVGFVEIEKDGIKEHLESAVLDKFNGMDDEKFRSIYGFSKDINDRAVGDLNEYDRFNGEYPEEEEIFFDDTKEFDPNMEEPEPF